MSEVKEVNINIPKKALVINKYNDSAGWSYFLGVIGAVIYFFGNANGFGEYVVGFLKALVWPAYFVYHLFGFLGIK